MPFKIQRLTLINVEIFTYILAIGVTAGLPSAIVTSPLPSATDGPNTKPEKEVPAQGISLIVNSAVMWLKYCRYRVKHQYQSIIFNHHLSTEFAFCCYDK